ncbi:hypothetical protein Tco_1359662 [Tanacetum coccineum]
MLSFHAVYKIAQNNISVLKAGYRNKTDRVMQYRQTWMPMTLTALIAFSHPDQHTETQTSPALIQSSGNKHLKTTQASHSGNIQNLKIHQSTDSQNIIPTRWSTKKREPPAHRGADDLQISGDPNKSHGTATVSCNGSLLNLPKDVDEVQPAPAHFSSPFVDCLSTQEMEQEHDNGSKRKFRTGQVEPWRFNSSEWVTTKESKRRKDFLQFNRGVYLFFTIKYWNLLLGSGSLPMELNNVPLCQIVTNRLLRLAVSM